LTDGRERRLQLGQTLEGRVRTHVLVLVEDGQAVLVLDRDDRLGEVAAGPGCRRELLRTQCVGVDVLAGEALDGRVEVGGDALGNQVAVVVGGGIEHPRATAGAHGHAGHRLDATGEDELVPARADVLRSHVDGLEARRAEAVDRDAARGDRQVRDGDRGAGDVGTLVADGADDTEDQVGDAVLVEVGEANTQLVDQARNQGDRLDGMQRARLLASAAWCSDGFIDECLGGHSAQVPSRACGAMAPTALQRAAVPNLPHGRSGRPSAVRTEAIGVRDRTERPDTAYGATAARSPGPLCRTSPSTSRGTGASTSSAQGWTATVR